MRAAHQELPVALAADVLLVLDIVFIVDLADDLLDDVFHGDEPRHAAVFVDGDRHVVAADAQLLQQHVDALGFGHEQRLAHPVAQVEVRRPRSAVSSRSRSLASRMPTTFSPSACQHGKARVPGIDRHRQDRAAAGSSSRTQIIWLCGTMMSRTCRSATSSTPSSIDSASVSSSPCCAACCRVSRSCARSFGAARRRRCGASLPGACRLHPCRSPAASGLRR